MMRKETIEAANPMAILATAILWIIDANPSF
jgi:hypothetical protein